MYKIKLEQFEGPLDLLLFFIKRDELNIYDIPISRITKEFLEYVNLIKLLDLEIAGDFILMASTLMHIKVRMLLPREVDEKGEEIDPRAELVAALLEYKKYKEMSEELSFLELIEGMKEKIRIVVTFIALLELTKMGKIGIKAAKDFNNFTLYKLANG